MTPQNLVRIVCLMWPVYSVWALPDLAILTLDLQSSSHLNMATTLELIEKNIKSLCVGLAQKETSVLSVLNWGAKSAVTIWIFCRRFADSGARLLWWKASGCGCFALMLGSSIFNWDDTSICGARTGRTCVGCSFLDENGHWGFPQTFSLFCYKDREAV